MGARDERAEVRAHARHRGGRQDHPPRHVLPDERQLLVRRLLQGRGDLLRVGARHRVDGQRRLRVRPRHHLGHGLLRRRRGGGALEADRGPARRADPAPRLEGQLLVHRRARPRRPVLGDLRRPRPRVRCRGWPGRRRGPLPRDLEPRLHAVRARRRGRQGGLPDPRRAQAEEHRHRHGARARRVPAAGRRQPVRDRRGLPGHRRRAGAVRQGVRRGARRRRPDARGRGPRAQRAHAHGRRRHAVERGPRLRAPSSAAPLDPRDAPARRRGPRAADAAAAEPRRDEPELPGARDELRADQPGRVRGGGHVPPHARGGHDDPRHRGAGGQGDDCARGFPAPVWLPGVPAPRHLRLPDRSHARDGGRAGRRGRRDRVPQPHEGAAGARAGGCAGEARGPGPERGLPGPAQHAEQRERQAGAVRRLHGLDREVTRGRSPRRRRPRAGGDRTRGRRGRAGRHAVLRGVGRPARGHRDDRARRRRAHRGRRRPGTGQGTVRAPRTTRRRHGDLRRGRHRDDRPRPAARDRRAPTRPRTSCTRRSTSRSARPRPRRAR